MCCGLVAFNGSLSLLIANTVPPPPPARLLLLLLLLLLLHPEVQMIGRCTQFSKVLPKKQLTQTLEVGK